MTALLYVCLAIALLPIVAVALIVGWLAWAVIGAWRDMGRDNEGRAI